ncbi:MAG: SMC family ATPase, partial [Dehalococcoidales bacterium]
MQGVLDMIPLKLAIRNFMPYRDNVPPLHFDGIHTASICGDNGNGKSALIDAMTWALWGEARGKSDDDLIHLGQTEMEVELEFAAGQQVYRVIRKHSKPKRQRSSGQTILEFQISSGDGFRSISDSSIRKTQQAINKVLHIDYPTFINSALLLQGRDNEFTVANPAKRKQVLADILALSLYDELEEQAKELAKEQEGEKSLLENTLADIGQELAMKQDYEEELRQAQKELSHIEERITEQESALNELRQKREHLSNCQMQLTQLKGHITETARALERWDEQVKQHHSRIKEYEDLLSRRETIEAGYEEFAQTRKLNEELNQKLAFVNRLNQGKHDLEMTIERAQAALVTEHKLAENKIAELSASSQRLPALKDELQQIERYLLHVAEVEKTLQQKKQEAQGIQTEINNLESGNAWLSQELLEIDEKLGLLSNQTEAKCPLCERELEMASLKLIETKFHSEKEIKSGSLTTNQAELARKKHQL